MISSPPHHAQRLPALSAREWSDPTRCSPKARRQTVGGKTLYEALALLHVEALTERIEGIENRLRGRSIVVPIQSLEPWPYDVIRPVQAVVQEEEGAFVASFFDANINASGESQLDAIEMLKDMLASSFRLLLAKESTLGEEPRRQLAVLKGFIRVR